mgnify:CR=1 FL=1
MFLRSFITAAMILSAGSVQAENWTTKPGGLSNKIQGGWDEAVRFLLESKPWSDTMGETRIKRFAGRVYTTDAEQIGWAYGHDGELLIHTENPLDDRELRLQLPPRPIRPVGPDIVIEDADGNTVYKGYIYD